MACWIDQTGSLIKPIPPVVALFFFVTAVVAVVVVVVVVAVVVVAGVFQTAVPERATRRPSTGSSLFIGTSIKAENDDNNKNQ